MNDTAHPSRMKVSAIQDELNELADRHNNRETRKAKHTWGTEGDRIREDADEARHEALTEELAVRRHQAQYNLGPSGIDPDEMRALTVDNHDVNNMRAEQ